MRVTVQAPAKLNLTLDILGRRDDGYHLVKMVMQSIHLFDTVTVSDTGDGEITLSCNEDFVPLDKTNTAYRAAQAFFEETGVKNPGLRIKIKKRIPAQAGLAGGSADGAAVLVALNEMMITGLSRQELCDIGVKVGADVPFCIVGGTMVASGIGTILTPLPDLCDCFFVVVKPPVSISTKEAYALSDSRESFAPPHANAAAEAICNANLKELSKELYNEFEKVLKLPEIKKIKEMLTENGALGACMSGSGSAVFGLFDDENTADDCAKVLKDSYDEVFVCEPVCEGCVIDE